MVNTRQIGAAPTALLSALGAAGAMSADGIMSGLKLNRRQFNDALRRLEIRGYASINDAGEVRLTQDGLAAAARGEVITGGPKGRVKLVRDTLRARAWAAMWVRRTFTIGDLVADAATDADAMPRDNIGRYLSRLQQAGYVREAPRRRPGATAGSNGFKVYVLVRRTGPKAPVYREATRAIHDPNIGEDVPCIRR